MVKPISYISFRVLRFVFWLRLESRELFGVFLGCASSGKEGWESSFWGIIYFYDYDYFLMGGFIMRLTTRRQKSFLVLLPIILNVFFRGAGISFHAHETF